MKARLARIAGATGLGLALVLAPATGAHADGASIGGYQSAGSGEVFSAFPTLPGFTVVEAPFEGTLALADTNLQAGGQAFAQTSILWPGGLAAGLGTLLKQAAPLPVAIPNYPIRAEAHEYSGPVSDAAIPGIRMQAFGSPEKADALSDVGAVVVPGIIDVRSSSSHSQSLVDSAKASTTVDVSLHGISLAGGAITIDAIKSTAATVSDGAHPTGKASTVITGLSVGGMPATLDAKGLHASGQTVPGVDPNAQIAAVLAQTGYHLSLTPDDLKLAGGDAEASSPALVVVAPTPGSGPVPAGFATIVLGATHSHTAASVGDVSDVGTDVGSTLPAVEAAAFGSTGGGPTGSFPDLSASGSGGTTLPATRSSAGPGATLQAAAPAPAAYHFGGVSPKLVLLALFLGILGVVVIRRYMTRLLSTGSGL